MVVRLETGAGRGLGVDVVQDLLASSVDQVGQGGTSTEHGAGSVADDDLGLLPEELDHVLVLGVPYRTADDGDGDVSVVHRCDVLLFSVGCDRPHDDVGELSDGQDTLVGVEQGYVASTAGCRPVDGEVDLSAAGLCREKLPEVRCRILDVSLVDRGRGGRCVCSGFGDLGVGEGVLLVLAGALLLCGCGLCLGALGLGLFLVFLLE